ncbi:uncharacterized protein LOC111398924 [Olea europaea var. sylvestris]|uniref:uncharacterized protein LOC111398924 n=1 Tax=Olea europaea var. sylvestris TaxID=158386 RepID=UPI000C1D7B4E|nr:uncharacterized protein LOC111398924 [Olea europaea var. sylvestris]
MGTKVHCESYLPGYYSMRNLNEDSSSSSWPLFYGDENLTSGQYYNGFTPRAITDRCLGHDKDALKQKMLEHETIFKNQVHELHRLYRTQRDMMEEIKRKELHKNQASIEPSSSSSLRGSHMPTNEARNWHMPGISLLNSGYGRTSLSRFEIVNSPLRCTKGNDIQAGPFQFQDGCTSKDCDALDSRPSKVRKKLFDLELPADEYIHTEEGEQLPDHKVSGMLSYISNGDPKIEAQSSMKISPVDGGTTDFRRDVSASGSHLRGSAGLVDLNEPIQIEEVTAPSSIGNFGHTSIHGETKGINQFAKGNPRVLGVPGETMYSQNGSLINSAVESKGNGRRWLSHTYEAGTSKYNPSSVTQGLQQNKLQIPCQSAQVMLNQAYRHPAIYPTGYSREDMWRDGPNRDHFNNSHLEPISASHTRGPSPSINSTGFSNLWSHSISSWTKPTNSSTQKSTTFQPSFSSSSGLHPYAQSQDTFGDKWQVNVSSRLNLGSGNDLTKRNGFHYGSATGSKELPVQLPLSGFDYLNCSRDNNVTSDRSTNPGFEKFLSGSGHVDLKPAIDINLNEVLPKTSSSEAVPLHDHMVGKIMPDDQQMDLPWLKPKPAYENEVVNTRRSELSGDLGCLQASSHCKTEVVSDLNQMFMPRTMLSPSDLETGAKMKISETQNVKKILGFPIFEPNAHNIESSDHVSTSTTPVSPPQREKVKDERKNRMIDINLAYESDEQITPEELIVEKEMRPGSTGMRHHIDLNTSISEDEDPTAPSIASNNGSVKIISDIDLEVPVLLDCEDDNTPSKENIQHEASLQSLEHKPEKIQDEVLRNAAETIFSISTPCQQIPMDEGICHPSDISYSDSLIWFVNVVSSHADELESKSGKESRVGDPAPFCWEIDEFEAMALQLTETKEEDYMPKPFVHEVEKVEEMGVGSNRTRRSQTRRGRLRRDFQRDILPGLTSLSRHEVTEDLQTFGGLMRATGHSWNSGLTRRNGTRYGGARGRRRTVIESSPTAISTPVSVPLKQQLSNIEARLEDGSLTGWGKTTRRPRRQRCPSGNLPTVALT